MRVFVTGAGGWIGSAVVAELLGAGHEVVGLARSETSAAAIAGAGAEALRGDLDDLGRLRAAASGADGVLHLAFKHDLAFSGNFAAAVTADRRAVDAMGEALAGSGRPLVIASGLAGRSSGGLLLTETDLPAPTDRAEDRTATERDVLALAGTGVRSASVRLAPTVHGEGDPGFVAALVGIARATGRSAYVGDGSNLWPAVHRSDAARLFRLAVESAPAGSVLHGAAEEGVPMRDIAEAIGRQLSLPVTPIAPEDAGRHFGWMAAFVGLDVRASSVITRGLLGWEPTGPGLLADLGQGHYVRDLARS